MVTLAGWTGGGGRTVKVRHPNGYETEYLHLSAISVRAGARIGQGDLVGRVGMTGLATGVHLHYGLKKNGRYVNPVIEHRNMPPGEPVPGGFINVFTTERDRYFALLFNPTRPRAQPTTRPLDLYLQVYPTPNLKSGESIAPSLNSKNNPFELSIPTSALKPASVSESSSPCRRT